MSSLGEITCTLVIHARKTLMRVLGSFWQAVLQHTWLGMTSWLFSYCQDEQRRLQVVELQDVGAGCPAVVWDIKERSSMYKMPTPIATRPQTIPDSQTENIMRHQIINLLLLIMIIGIGDANPMHPKNSLQRAVTFTQPTQPLEFRQKARKKPKKKNLKKSRLLRKMGLDFDGDWMSVDQPANADVFTVSFNFLSLKNEQFSFFSILIYRLK